MPRCLPSLLIGCLCLTTTIAAQDHPPGSGQVVRLRANGERVQGTISGQTDQALTLETRAGSRTIPMASVSGFEVRNRKNRGKGALIGTGIGIVVGGILAPLTTTSENCDCIAGSSLAEASITGEAVLLGALVGGTIGGLAGAFVLAPTRWTSHPLPTGNALRPGSTTTRSRVGLRFSF